MPTNSSAELPSHWLPSKSSVLTRVPHDHRKAINRAIIDYSAGSYREMYAHFELAAFCVSFTAFYFYARKIRTAATLAELRRPLAKPDAKTHQLLPDILAENLLDAALDVEHASSHKIARLARAYRVTQLALASRETHKATLAEAKRRADREGTQSILDHYSRLKELNRDSGRSEPQARASGCVAPEVDESRNSPDALDKLEQTEDSPPDT